MHLLVVSPRGVWSQLRESFVTVPGGCVVPSLGATKRGEDPLQILGKQKINADPSKTSWTVI